MRTETRTVRLGVATVLIAATAACGGPAADKPTSSAPSGPPAATITITDFTFKTPPSVPAGATIAVQNADPAKHSVTADSGNAFNVDVDAGDTATFTAPKQPGAYPYHCAYHPMMHGTLVVT